jgi:hypothetical protein
MLKNRSNGYLEDILKELEKQKLNSNSGKSKGWLHKLFCCIGKTD